MEITSKNLEQGPTSSLRNSDCSSFSTEAHKQSVQHISGITVRTAIKISRKKLEWQHNCICKYHVPYVNVAGTAMDFTCGKGEHLRGADLSFKHVHSKGFWLLKKTTNKIIFSISTNLNVLHTSVEKQTLTTLAVFLSTLWALVVMSLPAADFSKTAY